MKEVALAVSEYELARTNYPVSAVSIGIGASRKGVWGIAKSKVSTSGLLFFKRVKKLKTALVAAQVMAESDSTELFMIDSETQDKPNNYLHANSAVVSKKLFKIKTKKFRKGLKKAFKISKWLSQKAAKRNGRWYVKVIKVVFSLSYNGVFGLSTTTGSATTEIYLKNITERK